MLILPSVCLSSLFFAYVLKVLLTTVGFLHARHVFSDWIISMEANQVGVQFLPLTILPYTLQKYLLLPLAMELSTVHTKIFRFKKCQIFKAKLTQGNNSH